VRIDPVAKDLGPPLQVDPAAPQMRLRRLPFKLEQKELTISSVSNQRVLSMTAEIMVVSMARRLRITEPRLVILISDKQFQFLSLYYAGRMETNLLNKMYKVFTFGVYRVIGHGIGIS